MEEAEALCLIGVIKHIPLPKGRSQRCIKLEWLFEFISGVFQAGCGQDGLSFAARQQTVWLPQHAAFAALHGLKPVGLSCCQ